MKLRQKITIFCTEISTVFSKNDQKIVFCIEKPENAQNYLFSEIFLKNRGFCVYKFGGSKIASRGHNENLHSLVARPFFEKNYAKYVLLRYFYKNL